VKKFAKDVLKTEAQSVFGYMRVIKQAADIYRINNAQLPEYVWDPWDNRRSLLIGENRLHVRDLQKLANVLGWELHKRLDALLFDIDTSNFPSADELYDDTQERSTGYWFGLNPETNVLVSRYSATFFAALAQKKEFAEGYLGPGTSIEKQILVFQREPAQRWLRQLKEYLYLEATAIHLLSGQPPRATELMSLNLTNTPHKVRNVFIVHGLGLVLKSTYHKGEAATGFEKPIVRVPPKAVAAAFVKARLLAFDLRT
jgi:Fe-S cluster biosynthesis and repair protein YggX